MTRGLLRAGRRLFLPVLACAVVLAGCAADGGSVLTGDDLVVEMFDNRFAAEELHVPVGGSVTFVGAGLAPHNAVAADGAWSTKTAFGSLEQFQGDEATLTFYQPGTYEFFCTFHGSAKGSGMAATLIVGDAGASAAAQGSDVSRCSRRTGWSSRT